MTLNVAVLDDNEDEVDMMLQLVGSKLRGANVVGFVSPEAFLARAKEFDVLLTDFTLSGHKLNGHDVAVRFKQANPAGLVAVVSGWNVLPPCDAVAAKLMKPISFSALTRFLIRAATTAA